jgi:subtilisin family serine protease
MTSVRPAALVTLASTALAALWLAHPLEAREARTATRPSTVARKAEAKYALGTVILKLHPRVANVRRSVEFDIPPIDGIMRQIGATGRTPLFPRAPFTPYEPMGTSGSGDASDAHGFDRVYIVSYDGPFDAKWVAERLVATQAVEYAEPYYFFETDSSPVNDPQAAQQYWLSIIKAQEAWDVTKGSEDVIIAIVDSGVDWTHEDLNANIWENPGETGTDGQGKDMRSNNVDDDGNGYVDDWHGWDLVGDIGLADQSIRAFRPDNNPAPRQVNVAGYTGYHGTTVAGCASASTNNGKGIASPGYNSKILPVKAAADTSIQAINAGYEGITYAADMHATIINCSFGGVTGGSSAALQQVIDYARSQGSLVVAAAGNESQNMEAVPHVPAGLNGVLSVGATSSSDYADTTYTNNGLTVDVWAPGTNILTTFPGNQYAGNGITGTSFASPVTAGVAALVAAEHPEFTPEQIAMQLRVTGDRVKINNASRFAPHFYRRINAQRAVVINRSLASGQRFPGIAITSLMINGKFRDSLRSLDDVLTVQLSLKNILAPTTSLTIDTWPGQMLHAVAPVSVPVIETDGTANVELQLAVDPDAADRFSEGAFDLVLRMSDGQYEDVAPIRIPVKLAGWRQMARFGGASAKYNVQSIAAASPNAGWAVCNVDDQRPAFARTIDGRSWQSFRNIVSSTDLVYCVEAVDQQTAWAGSSPSSGLAGVYRTTNGGTSWTKTSVSTITPFVDAIHFFDAQRGILIGDPASGRWGIGVTTDGGATWKSLSPAVAAGAGEAGWNNAFTAFGENLWFGTNNNRIFHSTNGGATWTSAQTPGLASFSLAFTSPDDGIAVFKRIVVNNAWSGQNLVAITRNGGTTWQTIQLPYGMTAESATAIPGTTRILLATESGILETSDLGATWNVVPAPASVFNWKASESGARYGTGVQLAAAADDTTIAAYGANSAGYIVGYRETESTSAAPLASERTRTASLLEPYPNPSAGTTTLAYDLARDCSVRLELFDATGAALRTLVDAPQSAGRHAVVLDAAGIAAGTYHAVLSIGGERFERTVVIVR